MSLKSNIIKAAAGLGLAALPIAQAMAGDVSVGGGVRTSFTSTDFDDGDSFSDFAVNSARIYISGKATENISFMFNTEYNSNDEEIRVIDAVAQFSFSGAAQHLGRPLPAAERSRQSLRSVLREPLGRVPGRRAGRLSVRNRRPR